MPKCTDCGEEFKLPESQYPGEPFYKLPKDAVSIACDYSSLELRFCAELSKSKE